MAYYKLTGKSPLIEKVQQLEDLCEDLGIQISVGFNQQIWIEHEGEMYQYRDIEHHPNGYETTTQFPLPFETMLVREKD